MSAIITSDCRRSSRQFRQDLDGDRAPPRPRLLEGRGARRGHAILNRDNDSEFYPLLEKAAIARQRASSTCIGFGENGAKCRHPAWPNTPRPCRRLCSVWATLGGHTLELTDRRAPGRHIAENALAVLGAASLVGADIDSVAAALATLQPEKGRGERHRLAIGSGALTLIDESYNANPASMRAAIALLRDTPPGEGGRRIAILGDMLEMGEFAADVHAKLAAPLVEAGITDVWLAGPEMAHLRDALPGDCRVEYRETVTELNGFALDAVSAGDVVMIKSSKGTGCGRIVAALLDKYPAFSDTGPAK